jgi:hypothetical protein
MALPGDMNSELVIRGRVSGEYEPKTDAESL